MICNECWVTTETVIFREDGGALSIEIFDTSRHRWKYVFHDVEHSRSREDI
jgi:hypothetical protein